MNCHTPTSNSETIAAQHNHWIATRKRDNTTKAVDRPEALSINEEPPL
jgi:hypothetical protein